LCGTPGLPTGREECDNPSVAVSADHPAHRSLQGPHRRPCLLAPRNNARTANPLPQPRQKRCPMHAGCTRASHTQARLLTSRSCAPPFPCLLDKHGKAGSNYSASARPGSQCRLSTQSGSLRLTAIRRGAYADLHKHPDTRSHCRNSLKRQRAWRIVHEP
jgi:hypothetical protein